MKLGKLPAKHDLRTLQYAEYRTPHVIAVPAKYGHDRQVIDWGMLGNDQYGDCAFAGSAHETMLWTTAAGKPTQFTTENVLSDYAALTGFDPKTGANDNGTVMLDLMNYRRKVGIVDANGNRHKIAAYVKLETGNIEQLHEALYLFGAVAVGFEMPASAMAQFDRNRTWSVVSGSPIEGGHYVPVVGRHEGSQFEIVTWGRIQRVTNGFYRHYNDESYALISEDYLMSGKTPEGFDMAALVADLAKLPHVG